MLMDTAKVFVGFQHLFIVKKKNTWPTRHRRKLLKSECYKELWQTLYLMVKY